MKYFFLFWMLLVAGTGWAKDLFTVGVPPNQIVFHLPSDNSAMATVTIGSNEYVMIKKGTWELVDKRLDSCLDFYEHVYKKATEGDFCECRKVECADQKLMDAFEKLLPFLDQGIKRVKDTAAIYKDYKKRRDALECFRDAFEKARQ